MKHCVTTIKQMLNVYGFKYAFKHPELRNHKHLLHYLLSMRLEVMWYLFDRQSSTAIKLHCIT